MAGPTPVGWDAQESHLPWSLPRQGTGPHSSHQSCLFTTVITAGVPPGRESGTRPSGASCFLSFIFAAAITAAASPASLAVLLMRVVDGLEIWGGFGLNLCHSAYLWVWQPLVSPGPRGPRTISASGSCLQYMLGLTRLHFFLRKHSAAILLFWDQ